MCMENVDDFVLIDMDLVEIGNMRRQIVFSTNDIGSYKVDCVKRAILARSPTAHVHLYKQSFQSVDKQQLRSVQVIFGCTDNLEAREAINQFALTHSVGSPWNHAVLSLPRLLVFNRIAANSLVHDPLPSYAARTLHSVRFNGVMGERLSFSLQHPR